MPLTREQDEFLTKAWGAAFGVADVQPTTREPTAQDQQRAAELALLTGFDPRDFGGLAAPTEQPAPTATTTSTKTAAPDEELATMRSALDVQRQKIEALGKQLGIDPAAKPRSTVVPARAPALEEAQRLSDARALLLVEAKRAAEVRANVKARKRIDKALRKAAR